MIFEIPERDFTESAIDASVHGTTSVGSPPKACAAVTSSAVEAWILPFDNSAITIIFVILFTS